MMAERKQMRYLVMSYELDLIPPVARLAIGDSFVAFYRYLCRGRTSLWMLSSSTGW